VAVRSKRLWGPVTPTALGALAYTCPDNETSLVKDITAYNSTGLAAFFAIFVNGINIADVIYRASVPAGLSVQLTERFIVLQPGETIFVSTPLPGLTSFGFGAQLEGVAD